MYFSPRMEQHFTSLKPPFKKDVADTKYGKERGFFFSCRLRCIQKKKYKKSAFTLETLTVKINATEAVQAGLTRVWRSPPSGQTCPLGCCR